MKMLTRLTWGSAKFWLGAVIVVVAALAVTRDSTPTNAVNPEILPSVSSTSPTYVASLIMVKGGHPIGNAPCSAGETDPTTLCLRVWAKGVNNSTGASGFQVHYAYPNDRLSVSQAYPSTAWLGSTGRSAACPGGTFTESEGLMTCTTLLAPPPFGATGNGIIATLELESRNVTGMATIDFSGGTYLVDTPPNPDDITAIPATVRSINIVVAPCADFDSSGRVVISDILNAVQHYNTTDPLFDLDGSGLVSISDILTAVLEYGIYCTP